HLITITFDDLAKVLRTEIHGNVVRAILRAIGETIAVPELVPDISRLIEVQLIQKQVEAPECDIPDVPSIRFWKRASDYGFSEDVCLLHTFPETQHISRQ